MLTTIFPLFIKNIGVPGLIVIVVLLLVFFGGKKIPELMRGMGRGIKEFKDAIENDHSKDSHEPEEAVEEAPRTEVKRAPAKSVAKKSAPQSAGAKSTASKSAAKTLGAGAKKAK